VAELFRFAMVDIGDSPTARRAGEVASEMARIGGADAVFEEAGEQSGGPLVATLDFVGKSMVALAAAIALAGLVVGGLMVARTVGRASMDTSPLVASGMTAGQRSAAIALAMAPCSIAAGVMALVVAVASSAVIPFGLARRADPDTGLRLDALSLTVGAMLTVGAVIVTVAVLAWRAVRREVTHRGRHNTVVARLAATGLPVGPLVGVDLAVGAGSKGPPAGNHFASVAVAMAVAAGVGALVLGASIDRLESTPSAFGWTWDFVVPDSDVGSLADDPDVESLAIVTSGTASIDGRQIVMRGVETVKGPPPILVLEGRLPGKGEVVLGKRTMADLDVDLGDSVHAEGSEGGVELRVVGQAVFAGILDVPEASWGAAVDASDLEALGAGEGNGAGAVIGLVDGADRDRFARRIESELDEEVATVEQPIELARLREIEAFPWILTSFLGAVGLLAVLNAVVTTARRRAGDLAVLRSLGLAPRGVFRAVTV
jgi:putative ABC transport system permease protein